MTAPIETPEKASGRLRQFFGNLALTLASIIFAFGIAEAMLRLVPLEIVGSASGDRGFFSKFDPKLGWSPIPSVRQYHSDQDFSVLVEQNSLGLRAPENIGMARTNGKYRALVLGDSYVWGYGAQQDDIFTNGAIHGRDDLELVNMGVSGYGTDQELLLYRDFGSKFDVDTVVLAFNAYNDISDNLSRNVYGYDKPYFTLENGLVLHDENIGDSRIRSVWNKLLTESRAASLVSTGLLNIRYLVASWWGGDDFSQAIAKVREPRALKDKELRGIDLTAAIIAALRDEVESRGAQFYVVYIPYKPNILAKVDNDHPLVAPLNERLDALGIRHYSPYASFLAQARAGTQLFNGKDNHFNAAGHKVFGEFLAATLPRP
jgi:hypothetical protein